MQSCVSKLKFFSEYFNINYKERLLIILQFYTSEEFFAGTLIF